MMTTTSNSLLSIENLHVSFGRNSSAVEVVRGVSIGVDSGETLAIVGESGSGKSLTMLAAMGLLPNNGVISAGHVRFNGRELVHLSERGWQQVRGRQIGMIFQDPLSALNPCLTVGYQIAEMFRRHEGMGRALARQRAVDLMDEVGIPDAAQRTDGYPHQFSGGMRQRVMIAMALALQPQVLIADEPTTALDVTVQAQILRLLRRRGEAEQLGMIIISHDLGVVARAAEMVAVMYAGRIVEYGSVTGVFSTPAHPYTRGLMEAMPSSGRGGQLVAIEGQPPDPADMPSGCAFHPRCPIAQPVCRTTPPELRFVASGRSSACHFAEDVMEAPSGNAIKAPAATPARGVAPGNEPHVRTTVETKYGGGEDD